jgi:hypothetical protein
MKAVIIGAGGAFGGWLSLGILWIFCHASRFRTASFRCGTSPRTSLGRVAKFVGRVIETHKLPAARLKHEAGLLQDYS